MRYGIGTKFIRYSNKAKRIETVVDFYTTTNINGNIIKSCYVTENIFMDQKVRNYDVAESTIARSEVIDNKRKE